MSASLKDQPLVTYHRIFEGSLQDKRGKPKQTNKEKCSKQIDNAESRRKSKTKIISILRESREDIRNKMLYKKEQ